MSNKVGFWWSNEKNRHFNVQELTRLFGEVDLDFVKVDLDRPLEDQGPFKAIVHKLSPLFVKAGQGKEQAANELNDIKTYFANHPETIIVDPLNNVEKLLDRYRQCSCPRDSQLQESDNVIFLEFAELTSTNQQENLRRLKEAGVKFPFVCKPSLAHGSTLAHQMCLIFGEDGLKDVSPPCVAQTFINHNAVLFKLYVLGDSYHVVKRPSLKNFHTRDHPTIFFNSHDISKRHSSSSLIKLDEKDMAEMVEREPNPSCLEHIVGTIRKHIGLDLFGIDLIIDNVTGRYAIIDINIFPSYDGVENFFVLFRDLVHSKIELREASLSQSLEELPASYSSGQEDSGIETSDSCDEKKNKSPKAAALNRTCKRSHSRSSRVSTGSTTCDTC